MWWNTTFSSRNEQRRLTAEEVAHAWNLMARIIEERRALDQKDN